MIVTAYPALHTRETTPTSVRIEAGQKVVSYTGDSAWTEHMPAFAKDADLLIVECYFFQKDCTPSSELSRPQSAFIRVAS